MAETIEILSVLEHASKKIEIAEPCIRSRKMEQSPIQLTRRVYEKYVIRPETLNEWISQCDDPEAVKAYLMVESGEFSIEDENRYYIGWSLFRLRNERLSHLPKLVFSVLPDYSNLAPEQQRLAEKAELDAFFNRTK